MKVRTETMKKARRDKRLSFTELAFKTGVSEDMIRKIENGERNPSEKTIFGLLDALELQWSKLVIDKPTRQTVA